MTTTATGLNGIMTWSEVRTDDIVEGSGGSLWAVDRIEEVDERGRTLRPRRITLVHAITGESRAGQPDPEKQVVVVVSAAEALEAAVAVTKVHLGGQEIGRKIEGPLPGQNEQAEWICPADYTHPGGLMGHLYVHHGVQGQAMSGLHLGALVSLHEVVSTTDRRGSGYVAHVHDPRYAEVERERVTA